MGWAATAQSSIGGPRQLSPLLPTKQAY